MFAFACKPGALQAAAEMGNRKSQHASLVRFGIATNLRSVCLRRRGGSWAQALWSPWQAWLGFGTWLLRASSMTLSLSSPKPHAKCKLQIIQYVINRMLEEDLNQRRSVCARLVTGDYITPQFNAQPRFDKPILIYWLMALSASFQTLFLVPFESQSSWS